MDSLEKAAESLRDGSPVMIFDSESRESEIDLVYPAWAVGPREIYLLRSLAGGLICYATTWRLASMLGLAWGDELISARRELRELAKKRPRYGDRTAFTVWVNHVNVKTGIRDEDRSLTIRELDRVVELLLKGRVEEARDKFMREFLAPGHVPILAARSIEERRGHTELAITLAKLARVRPSLVFAEMLSEGGALTINEARELSSRYGFPLVLGDEIVRRCMSVEVCRSG